MSRIILLGCVKTKRRVRKAPIGDLYDSPLWHRRRAYAEASGLSWGVLSAKHAVKRPTYVVRPYERQIREIRFLDGEPVGDDAWRWAHNSIFALAQLAHGPSITAPYAEFDGQPVQVEVHAGAEYVDRLRMAVTHVAATRLPKVRRFCEAITIEHPVKGLQIGEQLAFYNRPGGPEQLELKGVA